MKVIDNPRLGQDTADSLYERDFHAWSEQQATLLRAGRFADIDLDHLVEEIESMGSRERSELKNRMRVLLLHLLKYRYQPTARSSGWIGTINEQRNRLDLLLEDSPSLRRLLPEALAYSYPRALEAAQTETGLPPASFPETCPFTLEQVLDDGYWPD